jgi:hypothetical protein
VIDNILNGVARPFFGWISDIIARENTMTIVFALGALAYWGLGALGHTPYMFVLMAGLIILHLGRNLQPVPLDLHRHFRCEIRDHECRHPLHRERHLSLGRAAGKSYQELQRQLALGLRDRLDHEPRGRRARVLCAQADAAADYSAKLSQPMEDYRARFRAGLSAGAAVAVQSRASAKPSLNAE